MGNYKVTEFTTVRDTKNAKHRDLSEVLGFIENRSRFTPIIERIRCTGNKEERNKLKLQLPAVLFSGIFLTRSLAGFQSHSGLMVIDIDGLKEDEVAPMKQKLSEDKYSMAIFVSPSGLGLKVIVKIEKGNPQHHKEAFASLTDYYKTIGIDIDQSGSDVSRACYLSYDPDIYINVLSEQYNFVVAVELTKQEIEKLSDVEPVTDQEEMLKIAKATFEKNGLLNAGKGGRNHALTKMVASVNGAGMNINVAEQFFRREMDLPAGEIVSLLLRSNIKTTHHNSGTILSQRTLHLRTLRDS
jgi:hypothetical protein